MIIYLVTLFLALASIATYFILRKKNKVNEDKILKVVKILSIVFISLAFINVFLPDEFSLRYIWDFDYLYNNHDAFHAIERVFYAMSIVTLPIAAFFNKKNFNRATVYVVLPTVILNIFSYSKYIGYYTGSLTLEYATVFGDTLYPILTSNFLRSLIFGLIMSLSLVISVYILLNRTSDLKFEGKKDVVTFLLVVFGLLITNMPIYTIQQVLGYANVYTTDGAGGYTLANSFNFGDPLHLVFIIFVVVEGFVLTWIFRKKEYEQKYILLLVMAISLMFQYNTFFKTDGVITATRYPLQLCNIAGSFLIITLLTKSEKMFHFTVVCNVTGAIIAIALCDSTYNIGILYCMNIHYMVEHINVLIVPILGLTLGVFKPLTKKDYKHFAIGFAIYYVFILIIGTIFNSLDNYYTATLASYDGYFHCNYLFMFDRDAATRLVGDFVGSLFDINISFGEYVHLYLVQICVYAVFMGVCTLIFFGIKALFKGKGNDTSKAREA